MLAGLWVLNSRPNRYENKLTCESALTRVNKSCLWCLKCNPSSTDWDLFYQDDSKLGCTIPADNQTDQSDPGGISRSKARENTARKSRLVLVFFYLVKEVARDFQPIRNCSAADEQCNREIIP